MKIYLDMVLIINFIFDFLLLLSVSLILKRNTKVNRIILGAFIGSFTILCLFIKMTSFTLFCFKAVISIFMILVSFGYRDIKYTIKNILYLYLLGIVLGGFLYFLNIQFSYKNNGIIFYHNGLSINIVFLIIVSPIILYIYIKQYKLLKVNYNQYYKLNLYLNENEVLNLNAFLDTGNKLVDPYKKRTIILLDKRKILFDINEFKMVLVPYKTVNGDGLLKCIKVKKVDIDGIGIKTNFLVGLLDFNISIDGVDCIINNKLLEE